MKYKTLFFMLITASLSGISVGNEEQQDQSEKPNPFAYSSLQEFNQYLLSKIDLLTEKHEELKKVHESFIKLGIYKDEDRENAYPRVDTTKLQTEEIASASKESVKKLKEDADKIFDNLDIDINEIVSRCGGIESTASSLQNTEEDKGLSEQEKSLIVELDKKCKGFWRAYTYVLDSHRSDLIKSMDETYRFVDDALNKIIVAKRQEEIRKEYKAFYDEVIKLAFTDEEEYIVTVFACDLAPRKGDKVSSLISRIAKNETLAGILISSTTYCFSSNHKVYVIPITVAGDDGKPIAIYEEIGEGEVEDYNGRGGRMLFIANNGGIGLTDNQPVMMEVSGRNGMPRVYMSRDRR